MLKKIVMPYISNNIRTLISNLDFSDIREIRLRMNKPLIVNKNTDDYFINEKGLSRENNNVYMVTDIDIQKSLEFITDYSLYAFNDELKKGYITLQGGMRVGIAGKIVYSDNSVTTIKNISSINYRIPRQIIGIGENVIDFLVSDRVFNTLIISPPNCGKTTLLRDIIRILSNRGFNVGVVDERSEIAGSYKGQSQFDLGIRTDVIDSCYKYDGMMMLLRSMAPNVICVDEIGTGEDIKGIERIHNSGVSVIATFHGEGIESIYNSAINKKIFKRYVVLQGIGEIEGVYNENFKRIKGF